MESLPTLVMEDPATITGTATQLWRYLILIGAGIITGLGLVIFWFIRQALNGRLLGLLSPFIAPLIRMAYDSAIMQRLSSKRLPKMIMPRTWQQYLDMPPEFKSRLEVYNDTMIMIKELLYGPYAMCQLTARLFQPEFSQQLIRRKRDFQIYAAMVRDFMAGLERFEEDLRARTSAITDDLHELDQRLEDQRVTLKSWPRWQRLLTIMLSRVGLSGFLATTRSVRQLQRQVKATAKELFSLQKKRDTLSAELFRSEHRALIRIGTRLVHYDNSRMSNLMHMLGCAMEDMRATIHSGLIMEMLAADTEESWRVRDELGLTAQVLPFGFEQLRNVTKSHARGEMGSKGQMPREDELELYLRSNLRDHPRWGHFARYGAPDGSVGLSAAKFNYIPQFKRYLDEGSSADTERII